MTLEQIFSLEIKTIKATVIENEKVIFLFEVPGMIELVQCEVELNQYSKQYSIYELCDYVKCEAAKKYLIKE